MNVLQTKRLCLEPLVEAHAALLFGGLSDPELYRFIPQDPPGPLDALAERYRKLETRTSPDGIEHWLNWVARRRSDDRCVGVVQSTVRADGTALFAYEFLREFWGAGYATESCREVIEHLFASTTVRELRAEVDTRNVASMRLLDRLGFQRGATTQNADYFKGLASHEFEYSLVRPPRS